MARTKSSTTRRMHPLHGCILHPICKTAKVAVRLSKEIKKSSRDSGVKVFELSTAGSARKCVLGLIIGPDDTVWAGAVLRVAISIPQQYPMKPPMINFINAVHHPNVEPRCGRVQIDALYTQYTPIASIESLLVQIRAALTAPEPHNVLNPLAASQIMSDSEAYNKRVKECVLDSIF